MHFNGIFNILLHIHDMIKCSFVCKQTLPCMHFNLLNRLILFAAAACLLFINLNVSGQYLSNLSCLASDPVFTTYAAPMERSDYRLDQAYRMMWYDPDSNIEFVSVDGGSLGAVFAMNGECRKTIRTFYREPIITHSYPDLVQFYFYPFRHIRVEVFFDVYSSTGCFAEYKVVNEGKRNADFTWFPYFYLNQKLQNTDFIIQGFSFEHHKKRDGWMKNHDIPYVEDLQSVFMIDPVPDGFGTYRDFPPKDSLPSGQLNRTIDENAKYLIFSQSWEMEPGDSIRFRMVRNLAAEDDEISRLRKESLQMIEIQPVDLVKANESLFSKIPQIKFQNHDHEAIYWNAFNLMRQCMMPPEGECGYNYYVFSREPKWGWGYGGQVFHESLVLLAYAFMDPESAMNSQRVYMERQWENGYINYRTGPYLDEQIETNGEYTSSAPWYNWQNLEIYKITGDKKFLAEAYESGKKFYNYYVSNRDKDDDGLCEWGAHAVLESVRDARVAVWDEVGWPSNFEGPDVNAMLVSEAVSLAEIATELGRDTEARKWKEDAEKRATLINDKLWDSEDGFYYNVDKDTELFSHKSKNDLKIKEIIGFLPLWAGVADSAQAARLVEHLLNENEFWRPYGVPTLSAGHDYYNPIGYWNGPVWVQWNYLIFRALLDYGYEEEAVELANRVLDNMAYHLKKDHVFWEFYSADDRQAGWNQTYIWAGIAARFLIDLDASNHK